MRAIIIRHERRPVAQPQHKPRKPLSLLPKTSCHPEENGCPSTGSRFRHSLQRGVENRSGASGLRRQGSLDLSALARDDRVRSSSLTRPHSISLICPCNVPICRCSRLNSSSFRVEEVCVVELSTDCCSSLPILVSIKFRRCSSDLTLLSRPAMF